MWARRISAIIMDCAKSWIAHWAPFCWTWRRTLLEKKPIVCMGEFGHTGGDLTVNQGRDHNRSAFAAVFAGAGVKGGRATAFYEKSQ